MIDKSKMNECQMLIRTLIGEYEKKLSECGEQSLQNLELIYLGKKLDTCKRAYPEGYKPEDEAKRSEVVDSLTKEIKRKIKAYYDVDKDDIESFLRIIEIVEKANPYSAYSTLEEFKRTSTKVASNTVDSFKTIIPRGGLDHLDATVNRENQYYNEIINGIFATSDYNDLVAYSLRAVCEPKGMIARGNEIHYPDNPVVEIDDPESVMLKRPISVYSSDAKQYEPVIDFRLENGVPKIIYDSEWVAKVDKIDVKEEMLGRIPREFFKERRVFVRDENGEVCLSDTIKKS